MFDTQQTETAVLAAGFDDQFWFQSARNKLDDSCFPSQQARKVWQWMSSRVDKQLPLDVLAFPNNDAELRSFAVVAATSHTVFTHRDWWLSRLRNASLIRRKRDALAKGIEILEAFNPAEDTSAAELNAQVQEVLSDAEKIPGKPLPSRMAFEIANDVLTELDERSQSGNTLHGIATGFPTVDRKTGGLQPGKVWVFAGMPGDGKSVALQNVAEQALVQGKRVRWYPLEMPETEQVFRFMSSMSNVDNRTLYNGLLGQGEQQSLMTALGKLKGYGLEIVNTDNATASDIFADIEEARPNVAVIDYMQLMQDEAKRGESREQVIARLSRLQKAVAKRAKCCILNASQLNDDGRLRESRAIGQDADVVLIIRKPDKGQDDTKREWVCAKNRGGPRNWTQPMRFLGQYYRFQEETN